MSASIRKKTDLLSVRSYQFTSLCSQVGSSLKELDAEKLLWTLKDILLSTKGNFLRIHSILIMFRRIFSCMEDEGSSSSVN
ncbi:hypothetical protein TNCV_1780861 [Trichonephila clavipes]|nr:hypothetical protein TNCV_1780861 [Trichonephila clavipes]